MKNFETAFFDGFRRGVNRAADGNLEIKLDGNLRMESVNSSLVSLLGYKQFELLGRSLKQYIHRDELVRLGAAIQKTVDFGKESILRLRLRSKNKNFQEFNGVVEPRGKGIKLVLSSFNNQERKREVGNELSLIKQYVHKANRLVQYIGDDHGDNVRFKVYESLVNDNGIKVANKNVDLNILMVHVLSENILFINNNDIEVVFGKMPKVLANELELERIIRSLLHVTYRNSKAKPRLKINFVEKEGEVVLKFSHCTRFIGHIGDFVDLESVSEIKTCYKAALKMGTKFWFSSNPKGENCFYLKLIKQ